MGVGVGGVVGVAGIGEGVAVAAGTAVGKMFTGAVPLQLTVIDITINSVKIIFRMETL
jgi:hypothetical protein